jgi:regulator of sigma E protease
MMFHSVNGWILAILSFGFIIFIHELGHFLAAKRSGIRVEKFSIGFGPKLIGFRRGETEYCISLLPFGGFVKMPGENPEERKGEPGEFSSASVEHRIFVAIAGPAMNFLLGVAAFAVAYMIAGEVVPKSDETTEIGEVAEESPAALAGIQPGDRVISINGRRLHNWSDLRTRVMTQPDKELEIKLVRGGQERTVYLTPRKTKQEGIGVVGQIGVLPRQEAQLSSIEAGSWAESAGLQAGDRIQKVDGEEIFRHSGFYAAAKRRNGGEATLDVIRNGERLQIPLNIDWQIIAQIPQDSDAAKAGIQTGDRIVAVNGEDVARLELFGRLSELAQTHPGEPIQFELLRNGEKLTATLTPEVADENQIHLGGLDWTVSLSGLEITEPVRIEKYNLITAWVKGVEKSIATISLVFSTLGDLLSRQVSPRYLSGPLGIVSITARVAQVGFSELLLFIGFLSVNLGIVNLLPIPIADGGQILFFIIEKLRGKPLSVRKQVIIQQVSIVIIIGLFLYITFHDVLRVFAI